MIGVALRSLRRPAAVSAALLLAWLLAQGLSGPLLEGLGYLLPALLLMGLLRSRRYPGERTLLAAITRRATRSHNRAAAVRPHSPPGALLPRGGRLIGCALAVRPPPAPAASPT